MSNVMDLFRGPALGAIAVIILLAGGIFLAAFAALIAQFGLLIRLKPWNTTSRNSAEGPEAKKTERVYPAEPQSSPQARPAYPDMDEVVDAVWWKEEQ